MSFRKLYPYLKLRYHFECKTIFKILTHKKVHVGWIDLGDKSMVMPQSLIMQDHLFDDVALDAYLQEHPDADLEQAKEYTRNTRLFLDRMTLKHVKKDPHQFTIIAETTWGQKFVILLDASTKILKIGHHTYVLDSIS